MELSFKDITSRKITISRLLWNFEEAAGDVTCRKKILGRLRIHNSRVTIVATISWKCIFKGKEDIVKLFSPL